MPEKLTRIESDILDYLIEYLRENTYQPSIREIGRKFGIKSTKTVAEHLQSIADKGWIERDPSRSRGVRLMADAVFPRVRRVPCYAGLAVSGEPLDPESRIGDFHIDPALAECEDPFMLRMTGDEMRDEGILDGDMLLVDRAGLDSLQQGELVIARGGGGSTIARFGVNGANRASGKSSAGQPAVPVAAPIGEPLVGRVVGVYRRLGTSQEVLSVGAR